MHKYRNCRNICLFIRLSIIVENLIVTNLSQDDTSIKQRRIGEVGYWVYSGLVNIIHSKEDT